MFTGIIEVVGTVASASEGTLSIASSYDPASLEAIAYLRAAKIEHHDAVSVYDVTPSTQDGNLPVAIYDGHTLVPAASLIGLLKEV